MGVEREAELEADVSQLLLADPPTPGLVVMLEGCLERLEVVVVSFLQLLSDERNHAPVPILATQDLLRSSHVDQVSCSELVGFERHAEHVFVAHREGVADGIMYLVMRST